MCNGKMYFYHHASSLLATWSVLATATVLNNCSRYGDLRLSGGSTLLEGRVEVCNRGMVWNRICNDDWDDDDARVVCRQLGLSPVGSLAVRQGEKLRQFQASTASSFLFNQVNCHGSENKLIECHILLRYPNVNCITSGTEDAAVSCTNETLLGNITTQHDDTTIRLTWEARQIHLIDHFEIHCFYTIKNTKHVAQSIALVAGNSSTEISSVPQTTHNCCVSAVLDIYSYHMTICTEVTTSAPAGHPLPVETTMYACVSISEVPAKENFVAAVGTLGFLVVVLLTLLIVAVVALTYFILIKPKQMYRLQLTSKHESVNIDSNPSYSSVKVAKDPPISGRECQVAIEKTYDVVNTNTKRPATHSREKNEYDEIKETNIVPVRRFTTETRELQKSKPPKEKLRFETNPSYASLPRTAVGEYAPVGLLYHKSNKPSKVDADGYYEIQEMIKKSSQEQESSKWQRETIKDVRNFAGVHPLDVQGNPSYATLPSTPIGHIGEYSLAGPCEHDGASKELEGSVSAVRPETDTMKTGTDTTCSRQKNPSVLDKRNGDRETNTHKGHMQDKSEACEEKGGHCLTKEGHPPEADEGDEQGTKTEDDYIDSGYSLVT